MTMKTLIRLLSATLVGVAMALLVSCGSSGSGLIPSADAGPLRNDFEAVLQAASTGSGSCSATESALGKTEQDFLALPATIDRGLHARLQEGISNLHKRALEMCTQLKPTATSTTSTETTPSTTPNTTTTTETTPATTPSTPSTTPTNTQTTQSTETPANPGGGTEAPGEGAGQVEKGRGKDRGEGAGQVEESSGRGKDRGEGVGNPGGANAGGGQ
jgi:hypothetical protein